MSSPQFSYAWFNRIRTVNSNGMVLLNIIYAQGGRERGENLNILLAKLYLH